MRILHVADVDACAGSSGRGLLADAGDAYAAAGHQLVAVVPGDHDRIEDVGATRLVTLAAPRLPGRAGRRAIIDRAAVRDVLARVRPERVEVSGGTSRLQLIWLGREARRRGIPSLAVCDGSLEALLRSALTRALPAWATRSVADAVNRRLAAEFDTVVCTTANAAEEFARIGAAPILSLPFGGAGGESPALVRGEVRRALATAPPVAVAAG